jgi:signal transduction histidine kinase
MTGLGIARRPAGVGMRWWLALAFAGIAALTAVVVAQVFYARTETSIRERAGELAAGTAVAAATKVAPQDSLAGIRTEAAGFSARRRVALFVLDDRARLLTPARSAGVALSALPNIAELRESAIAGRRLVSPIEDGRRVTVVLPLRNPRAAALVMVVARPDLEDALGIVRQEIVSAALWAIAAGALVGVGVALLITRRIRRIAAAATAIEHGEFDVDLRPGFGDELGGLAETVDRMGHRLATSFALLESDRDRMERLLEQLHEGVVAIDRDLTVEFANARASALFGVPLTPGEPLPDPWPSTPTHPLARGLFAVGAEATSVHVHPEPSRTIVVTGLPPSLDGTPAVLVLVDATERQRRERAEREFVTNAAHELRTPLTAIANAIDALQAGAKADPDERDRFLLLVQRQTSRLGGLVRALLTLARAETGEEHVRLEPIALEPLLADVISDSETYGIPIALDVSDDLAVLGHRDLLRQALANLVRNAATHGAGVDVRVGAYPDPHGKVRLEVSDRGPGMTRLEADRVFDRFYRAEKSGIPGHGLGLAIVSAAIRAMDGELAVDAVPGDGTTVSIVLARAQHRPIEASA